MKRFLNEDLYLRVEQLTSHAELYFNDHVSKVAENCINYGIEFLRLGYPVKVSVCEIGGLCHDIGYTDKFEAVEGDHISRGCIIAYDLLNEFGYSLPFIGRVVDCIWTHDGNLHRSKFVQNGEPPVENIIVNDVDSMMLFEWPVNKVMKFVHTLKPQKKLDEIARDIIQHAEQTYSYIYHPYFKELALPKYNNFVQELNKMIDDGTQ